MVGRPIRENSKRQKHERICQCRCGYFIDTTKDSYVKIKKGCYHTECYIKKLENDKDKLSHEEAKAIAFELATKTFEENFKKSQEQKEDGVFISWLCQQYDIVMLSSRFYDVRNKIYKGTYKNMSMAIKREHLEDMWRQKMNYLNKVNDRNRRMGKVIEGEQRVFYDLAILINKYDDYLNWLDKNKIRADVDTPDVTTMTDNKVYDNLIAKPQTKNEQQDDVDEWF